jgi:hypothetical protein
MPAIRREIDKIVRRLPKGYRLELEDRLVFRDGGRELEADAYTDPYEQLIKVSLATNDPGRFARHEEIHAYKQLGLFSDEEWNTLTRYGADNDVRTQYDIDGRYKELYEPRHANNPDKLEEMLVEEMVAEMWADRVGGASFGGPVNRIIDRIQRFLRRIAEMLGAKGYLRVEDVYQRIESGEIGRRADAPEPQPAPGNLQEALAFAIQDPARSDSPNFLYSFAGERARTANLEARDLAAKMEEDGATREEIWEATWDQHNQGWFRGVDGKWRWEIDDELSWMTTALGAMEGHQKGRLADLMQHAGIHTQRSALGEPAYPGMANLKTELFRSSDSTPWGKNVDGHLAARSDKVEGAKGLHGITLHEVQHQIQVEEGFARGSHPKAISDDMVKVERDRLETRQSSASNDWTSIDTAPAADELSDDVVRHGIYQRFAGEVEARTVQARMNMTAEERRARPPWLDYDIPEQDQIVRMADRQSYETEMSAVNRMGEVGEVVEACRR